MEILNWLPFVRHFFTKHIRWRKNTLVNFAHLPMKEQMPVKSLQYWKWKTKVVLWSSKRRGRKGTEFVKKCKKDSGCKHGNARKKCNEQKNGSIHVSRSVTLVSWLISMGAVSYLAPWTEGSIRFSNAANRRIFTVAFSFSLCPHLLACARAIIIDVIVLVVRDRPFSI